MVFRRILQNILDAQPQSLAAIFCDEEGEMIAMAMQHGHRQAQPALDVFEFKVLAANAAVWVQSINRIQGSASGYPDMSLRFGPFHLVIQTLPRDHYLMLVALRRAALAQLRVLLKKAARACIAEM